MSDLFILRVGGVIHVLHPQRHRENSARQSCGNRMQDDLLQHFCLQHRQQVEGRLRETGPGRLKRNETETAPSFFIYRYLFIFYTSRTPAGSVRAGQVPRPLHHLPGRAGVSDGTEGNQFGVSWKQK